jgi:hypothetical protein
MSSSDAIVVWIFDRLALDVALAGDLREERAQGRSMIWHWRQCTGHGVRRQCRLALSLVEIPASWTPRQANDLI